MEIKENNKFSLNDFYNENFNENENENEKKLKSKIIHNLNSIFSSSSENSLENNENSFEKNENNENSFEKNENNENSSENNENSSENSPEIFSDEENFFKPWKKPSLIKKNTEIKISPLPENCTESLLYKLFSKFGSIINIEIYNTNAYIRFSSTNEMKKVLSLKKIQYLKKNIYIHHSNDNIEIFLANLDKKWNYKKLFNELKKFIKFKDIRMLTNNSNENSNENKKISNENKNNSIENNRGYCFIEFNNAIEARKSFKILKEKKIILNKFLTIDWAKGLNKENDINKFQLFIKGITKDININKLYEIFSIFGKINFIKLARDSNNNNNNNDDYGFITFDNEKDCENALKNFNSKMFFKDKILTVEYAKKLSSIKEHRERVSKNLLEKKRRCK